MGKIAVPHAETDLLFEPDFWQEINRSLYDLATKKDKVAMKLLFPARIMFEVISYGTVSVSHRLHLEFLFTTKSLSTKLLLYETLPDLVPYCLMFLIFPNYIVGLSCPT